MVNHSDDTLIALQNELIKELKSYNLEISNKCNVLGTTALSKDQKSRHIENELGPRINSIHSKISKLGNDIDGRVPRLSTVISSDDDANNDGIFQFNMNNSLPSTDDDFEIVANFKDDSIDELEFDGEEEEKEEDDDDDDVQIIEERSKIPPIVETSLSQNVRGTLDIPPSFQDDEDNISIQEILSDYDISSLDDLAQQPLLSNDNRSSEDDYNHLWSGELVYKLQNVFKLPNFRSDQLSAINATLSGDDVFILMPTGGGKSLCYQLPSIIRSGVTCGTTIVISPLISLMQDQIDHLLQLNIKACSISSKLSTSQRNFYFSLFANGDLDLLYISPEMLTASKKFKTTLDKLHKSRKLARIAVDEAHCLSNWGHDFRPDYKNLDYFRINYPDIPIVALTATANNLVQDDIIRNLRLGRPLVLKQSFNRNNLFYEVLPKDKKIVTSQIASYILNDFKSQSGIVYCHSKDTCEKVSMALTQMGVKASFYHAGMTNKQRDHVQKLWQSNRYQVICATVAFGMGIDKADVRFVIHYTVPRSLEGYYQETGRAGRDGNFSYCITFYSFNDVRSLQKLIQTDKGLNKENKLTHLDKLQHVMAYCENTINCRRKQILSYFNEEFDVNLCHKNCDNCLRNVDGNSNVVESDVTDASISIINLVQSIQNERVTIIYCQDILRGSKMTKIVQAGHDKLPEHGILKSNKKENLERIFFHLVTKNILQEYSIVNKSGFGSNYVKLGKMAAQLKKGILKVKLKLVTMPSTPSGENSALVGKTDDNNAVSNGSFFRNLIQERFHLKASSHLVNQNASHLRLPEMRWGYSGENYQEMEKNQKIVNELKYHQRTPLEEDTVGTNTTSSIRKRRSFSKKKSYRTRRRKKWKS
ncbi:hypothetical protein KAFR_0F01050 [Kazachstania africana CBS 2517]|uniref:ATP-dependent DNA helicase n=1 Tax=Kazachstania africana (strain ATCC 22294 / BCRC 22015 / CBS 2517 / CECT 1963 / NBRC 1671 / NRRL Y-8276) TaxID=1071382 RepID=H2AWF1_KAZAF|nr:hypothetical protein KAFR_0F01050 [Kazachstania africana CBS 2517]CCF58701.1 hypothetical protein KAFR_0F01050 [Kazachstania africana CBS 2517]